MATTQAIPPAPVPASPTLPEGASKTGVPIFGSIIEKVKGLIPKKSGVEKTTAAEPIVPKIPEGGGGVHSIPMKKLVVVAVVLVIVLLLVMGVVKLLSGLGSGEEGVAQETPAPITTPTPSPTPTGDVVRDPSPYFNDPDVVGFEDTLDELNKDMSIVSFQEEELILPTLDWDVKF